MSWTTPTANNEVARRAGGRRRYNAQRQCAAMLRQLELLEHFEYVAFFLKRGTKAKAARLLGVSPATITRDVRALQAEMRRQQERAELRLRWLLIETEVESILASLEAEQLQSGALKIS
jgi:hypothetical protein